MGKNINLQETPGKTVGRRVLPPAPLDPSTSQAEGAVKWREAFGNARIPKGVYRFTSHEEANEWLWKTITRNPEN